MNYEEMSTKVYVTDNSSDCSCCLRRSTCKNVNHKRMLEEELKAVASKYTKDSTTGLVIRLGCYGFDPSAHCKVTRVVL